MEPCGGSSQNVLRAAAIVCQGTPPTQEPVSSKTGTQAPCAEVKGWKREAIDFWSVEACRLRVLFLKIPEAHSNLVIRAVLSPALV